jgi:hypothetical protein
LGFVVADGVGGGPAEGSVSAVVEFDGSRVLGDVDGDFAVGVGTSESDFLSNDHDDATADLPLTNDGRQPRPGSNPSGAPSHPGLDPARPTTSTISKDGQADTATLHMITLT